MAVGETQVERNKAYLSLIQRKVYLLFVYRYIDWILTCILLSILLSQLYYILDNVWYRRVIRSFMRRFGRVHIRDSEFVVTNETLLELREKEKAITNDIKVLWLFHGHHRCKLSSSSRTWHVRANVTRGAVLENMTCRRYRENCFIADYSRMKTFNSSYSMSYYT